MKLFILLSSILISFYANAHDDKYHLDSDVFKLYTTATFAPFNYIENGKLKGFAIDLVTEMMKDARFKHTSIKPLPWARAYKNVKHTKNSMVFAMYKTSLREDEFIWVGPILKSSLVLLAKKDKKIDDNHFSIASVRESAGMQTSLKRYPNLALEAVNNNKLCIKLLSLGRVDTCATGIISAYQEISALKLNKQDFTVYKKLKDSHLYLGINKTTPLENINFLTEKLHELEKNGFVDHLKIKYHLNNLTF